jgi:hypothetical protein
MARGIVQLEIMIAQPEEKPVAEGDRRRIEDIVLSFGMSGSPSGS